ncbi:hypothetical protein BLNAU_24681 [Blattamonas nauphoetae]|uniref:Cadherin domain-containing protein n=1 Tax=Blattamonas nauphoetae TaxID=2049346 RepID=A0ABQ9WLQ9_9EUKA|nr:hypothetical protein BLNAU_24681 [Blattamonas nauphoetae]
MQFNTTYSIVSVTKGGEHVLLNQTSLTTPLGPTLETVSTVLNASNKNNVIFTLTGSRMMTGSHTLFVEQGQSTQINVSVSIDTATTGSGEEVLVSYQPFLSSASTSKLSPLSSRRAFSSLPTRISNEELEMTLPILWHTKPDVRRRDHDSIADKWQFRDHSGLFDIRDSPTSQSHISRMPFHQFSQHNHHDRVEWHGIDGEMGMIVVSSDDGSFVGPSNSTPSTLNENDDDDADSSVCCWETGIMQLDNCSTRIDNTKFSNLQQGGINMKGGNLSIQTSASLATHPTLTRLDRSTKYSMLKRDQWTSKH